MVMNLLSKLEYLYKKRKQALYITPEDVQIAKDICTCEEYIYKDNLITTFLCYYKENWCYLLLKELSHDKDEVLRVTAINELCEFLKVEDFWELYNEFESDNRFVLAAAIAGIEYIGYRKNINVEVQRKRIQDIKEKYDRKEEKDLYVEILLNVKLFLLTNNYMYLEELEKNLCKGDYEDCYQMLQGLDELIDAFWDDDQLVRRLRKNLKHIVEHGDSCRRNRIYALQIYRKNFEEHIKQEDVPKDILSKCIYQIYYPVEERMIDYYDELKEEAQKTKDIQILIFGAYVNYNYGRTETNWFLEELLKVSKDRELKAVTLMLQGLWELQRGEIKFGNIIALKYFQDALEYAVDIPMIYDMIGYLTSIEENEHQLAIEKSKALKQCPSDLDNYSLDKLYSFETFYQMSILRKIKMPEYFLPIEDEQ